MWKTLTKPFRHNSGLCLGLVISVAVLAWVFGCAVTTKSPTDPEVKLTRMELDAEVENIANKIALAYSDIAKQEEIRSTIMNIGVAYVTGEGVSPVGIVTTLAALAGLGAVVDNRRKDAVIKSKNGGNVTVPRKIKRRKT